MGTEFDKKLVRLLADRFQQHITNLILDHIDIKDEFDPMFKSNLVRNVFLKKTEKSMDKKKQMKINDIQEVAERVAAKTREKHMSYGGALDVSHMILNVLYPDGVLPGQFFEFEVVSRIIEKLCRITRGNPVAYGESPWEDIIGYSLLAHKEFHNKEIAPVEKYVDDEDEEEVVGDKKRGYPPKYKEKNDVND